jgi:hypothetical protein
MSEVTANHTPLGEKIQNMLDELPDDRYGKQREHALSKQDARWLANLALVISEGQCCRIGFTEDQILALRGTTAEEFTDMKGMVKERRKILALVGTFAVTVMAYIGQKVIESIDPHFWSTLFKSIFHVGTKP